MQQLVEKKALAVPAAQPHVQPSHDALRAAKLANRRELGLPVSPLKPSAQQTVKPQGRGARLLAGGQKAASGNPAPTSSIWRNPTTKQTGSVISTSPPVSNVSDLETASSLNPDWTSHDEAELLSPRVPQSSQKQLRRSLVAKGTASEAASSPMTPNAIKAFQPVPSEHDDETLSSVTTPTAESLLGLHQDKDAEADAESFSSDIDQDHLFCLDGGSSSDSPEMFLLDSALVHDFITFPDLHTKAVEGSKALQLEQQFLDVLALQKAHKGAAEYQMLGFSKQQSVAAVNKFGDNMELGVSWLLRTPEQYLQVHACNSL